MNRFKTLRTVPGLLLILAALTVLAYSFMVGPAFKTLDDEYSIVNNESIRSAADIGQIMTSSYFGGDSYYRPLVMLTYMAEYHCFGLNPFYYYIDNILLHLASVFLVFFLIDALLRHRMLAFGTALLFAIHPVQWEAVSNIPGRAILLSGFFSLAVLLCYVLSRISPGAGKGKRRGLYALALVLFVPALLSKESAAMVPALLCAFEFFLARRLTGGKRRFLPTVPFFAILAALVLWRQHLGITHLFLWRSPAETGLGFLTFLRAVLTYWRLLLVPYDLHFDRARMLFTSYAQPELWITLAVFVALAVFLWRARAFLSPEVKFFIAWFAIEMFPVSQLIASIGTQPGYISTAEHFLYTSAIGLFALAAMAVRRLYRANARARQVSPTVFVTIVAAVLALYFSWTVQYNIYSSNEMSMCLRSLKINPSDVRIRNSLAFFCARHGLFHDAELDFRKVLALEPWNARARIGLGKALIDQGKDLQGWKEYQKVGDPGALKKVLDNNIKDVSRILITRTSAKLAQHPDDPVLNYSLGVFYVQTGQIAGAVPFFEKAVALKPGFKDALFNLAACEEALGRPQKAAGYYERALATAPASARLDRPALEHLAGIYARLGMPAKARAFAARARALGPAAPRKGKN